MTLADIQRDILGCTPGARGCLVHGRGWPCDVLVDAESRVQAWHEGKLIEDWSV